MQLFDMAFLVSRETSVLLTKLRRCVQILDIKCFRKLFMVMHSHAIGELARVSSRYLVSLYQLMP